MRQPVCILFGVHELAARRIALRLRERGTTLVLADLPGKDLDEAASALDARTWPLDARLFQHTAACFEHTRGFYGRLDGVVHCVSSGLRGTVGAPGAVLDKHLADSVRSAFAITSALLLHAPIGGTAHVLVHPLAGRAERAVQSTLDAERAALDGIMRSAEQTRRHESMRFNAVDASLAQVRARHGLASLPERIVQEVAHTTEWLLDPAQSWISGQVFGVDGLFAGSKPTC